MWIWALKTVANITCIEPHFHGVMTEFSLYMPIFLNLDRFIHQPAAMLHKLHSNWAKSSYLWTMRSDIWFPCIYNMLPRYQSQLLWELVHKWCTLRLQLCQLMHSISLIPILRSYGNSWNDPSQRFSNVLPYPIRFADRLVTALSGRVDLGARQTESFFSFMCWIIIHDVCFFDGKAIASTWRLCSLKEGREWHITVTW